MFFKIDVLKKFANFIGKHQCWSMGPSIKDARTFGEGGRGVRQKWTNADRGRGEWLAKCGRPLGKKL